MQQRDAAAAPQGKSLFVRLTTPRSANTLRADTYSAFYNQYHNTLFFRLQWTNGKETVETSRRYVIFLS